MQSKNDVSLGRFISLILRHKPETIGIRLDEHGWAEVPELLEGINRSGRAIDMETLERIVRENEKQRYAFNQDHTRIRARQGHSLEVDVELQSRTPPDTLYHGTAERFLNSILKDGICRQSRQYVHLSREEETAFAVGRRHGKPVVLVLDAGRMNRDGTLFYCSENGVWMCGHVPPEYILEIKREEHPN